MSSAGTPSSIIKVFSAVPASALLAIGYISAKYDPFENTCAYRLPSMDFTLPSIVSDAHIPSNLLVWNALSALYRLANGMTAERASRWVVRLSVSFACSSPICHRSLSSSGDTDECRPLD